MFRSLDMDKAADRNLFRDSVLVAKSDGETGYTVGDSGGTLPRLYTLSGALEKAAALASEPENRVGQKAAPVVFAPDHGTDVPYYLCDGTPSDVFHCGMAQVRWIESDAFAEKCLREHRSTARTVRP